MGKHKAAIPVLLPTIIAALSSSVIIATLDQGLPRKETLYVVADVEGAYVT